MIPLPQILSEFIMALGGALFLASVWALLRPRMPRAGNEPVSPPARGRVLINAFIGLVVLVWGFASFVTHGSS